VNNVQYQAQPECIRRKVSSSWLCLVMKTMVREASKITFKPRNLGARFTIIQSLASFHETDLTHQVEALFLPLVTLRIMTMYKPLVKCLWLDLSNEFAPKCLWNGILCKTDGSKDEILLNPTSIQQILGGTKQAVCWRKLPLRRSAIFSNNRVHNYLSRKYIIVTCKKK